MVPAVWPMGLISGYCTLNTYKGSHPVGQLSKEPELPEAMFVNAQEQIPKSTQGS